MLKRTARVEKCDLIHSCLAFCPLQESEARVQGSMGKHKYVAKFAQRLWLADWDELSSSFLFVLLACAPSPEVSHRIPIWKARNKRPEFLHKLFNTCLFLVPICCLQCSVSIHHLADLSNFIAIILSSGLNVLLRKLSYILFCSVKCSCISYVAGWFKVPEWEN